MNSVMKKSFNEHVSQWQAYVESPLGAIRQKLVRFVLEKYVTEIGKFNSILDAGCGLADTAVLWLKRDCQLFLCDYAPAMLDVARENLLSRYPEREGQLHFIETPVEELTERFEPDMFDLILCHTLLEYTNNAQDTLDSLSVLLKSGGLFSCMVVNCYSEAWQLAIRKHDPVKATAVLEKKLFSAGLFQDVRKRTFSFAEVREMLNRSGFQSIGEFGLRIFSDFYPEEKLKEQNFYNEVIELERQAIDKDPYRQMCRYIHIIARKR